MKYSMKTKLCFYNTVPVLGFNSNRNAIVLFAMHDPVKFQRYRTRRKSYQEDNFTVISMGSFSFIQTQD